MKKTLDIVCEVESIYEVSEPVSCYDAYNAFVTFLKGAIRLALTVRGLTLARVVEGCGNLISASTIWYFLDNNEDRDISLSTLFFITSYLALPLSSLFAMAELAAIQKDPDESVWLSLVKMEKRVRTTHVQFDVDSNVEAFAQLLSGIQNTLRDAADSRGLKAYKIGQGCGLATNTVRGLMGIGRHVKDVRFYSLYAASTFLGIPLSTLVGARICSKAEESKEWGKSSEENTDVLAEIDENLQVIRDSVHDLLRQGENPEFMRDIIAVMAALLGKK